GDMRRTFVFTDEESNKFWNIELRGARTLVTFGKVGSKGQTQLKDFPDEEAARRAHDKLVAEKLAKGYVEITPRPAPAAPLQRSLEAAPAASRQPMERSERWWAQSTRWQPSRTAVLPEAYTPTHSPEMVTASPIASARGASPSKRHRASRPPQSLVTAV